MVILSIFTPKVFLIFYRQMAKVVLNLTLPLPGFFFSMIPGGGLAFPPRPFISPGIYKHPFGLILSPEFFQSP